MQDRLSENQTAERHYSLLVLAAGLSTRFGGEKLCVEFEGKPLLQHVLDTFCGKRFWPKVLVIKPGFSMSSFSNHDFEIAVNESPEEGISSSIRKGLEAIGDRMDSGIIVLLGDMPLLRVEDAEKLVEITGNNKRTVASFEYGSKKGFPTLVTADLIPLVEELEGDRGVVQLVKEGLSNYLVLPGEARHTVDFDYSQDFDRTESQ